MTYALSASRINRVCVTSDLFKELKVSKSVVKFLSPVFFVLSRGAQRRFLCRFREGGGYQSVAHFFSGNGESRGIALGPL